MVIDLEFSSIDSI